MSTDEPTTESFRPLLVTTGTARRLLGGSIVFDYLADRGLKPSFVGAGRGGTTRLYDVRDLEAALDEAKLCARGATIKLGASAGEHADS